MGKVLTATILVISSGIAIGTTTYAISESKKNNGLRRQLKEANNHIVDLKTKNNYLLTKNKGLDESIGELSGYIQKLTTYVNTARTNREIFEDRIKELTSGLVVAENELSFSKRMFNELSEKLRTLRENHEDTEGRVRELLVKLKAAETSKTTLQNKVKDLEESLTAVMRSRDNADHKVKELNLKVMEMTESNDIYEKLLHEQQATISEQEDIMQIQGNEIVNMRAEMDNKTKLKMIKDNRDFKLKNIRSMDRRPDYTLWAITIDYQGSIPKPMISDKNFSITDMGGTEKIITIRRDVKQGVQALRALVNRCESLEKVFELHNNRNEKMLGVV